MAVLPTFTPAGRPGEVGATFLNTLDKSQSLMERADANRRANQLAEQQRVQFDILKPVIQAKAQADIASAGATLANAKMQQDLRKRAALEAPMAQKEFESAMSVNIPAAEDPASSEALQPDWNGVFDTLQNLRAKYNYMSLLPEYKGFIATLDDASAKAFTQGQTIAHIQSQQMMAAQRNADLNARNRATNEARVKAAMIAAEASLQRAAQKPAAQPKAEGGTSALISGLKQALDSGDMMAAQIYWAQLHGPKGSNTNEPFPYAPNVNKTTGEPYPEYAPQQPAAAEDTSQPAAVMFYPNPADVPAQEDEGAESASSVTEERKLYKQVPGGGLNFAESVKTNDDKLKAVQQMLDDHVIEPDQARKLLTSLGFTPKK